MKNLFFYQIKFYLFVCLFSFCLISCEANDLADYETSDSVHIDEILKKSESLNADDTSRHASLQS